MKLNQLTLCFDPSVQRSLFTWKELKFVPRPNHIHLLETEALALGTLPLPGLLLGLFSDFQWVVSMDAGSFLL